MTNVDNKKRIIRFLEKHPETDNFKIMVELNIDINQVENILDDLIKEGIICLNV